MEWEYNTKEEAEIKAAELKHLIGKEITHIKTEFKCIVKDVYAHPNTWYNNSVTEIRGYDVKISFTNQPFTTYSNALETHFKLD